MTKAELFVRSILGPARCDIRPLAAAIEVTAEFLQAHSVGTDDLLVTKDVYPPVARRLGKSIGAVSKCVERLSKLCWETLQLRGAVEHGFAGGGEALAGLTAPQADLEARGVFHPRSLVRHENL